MYHINKRTVLHESPYVRYVEKELESPSGVARYATFDFPEFCNVIAVTEHSQVVLVKQYRVGIEDFTLEIPGGCIDAGDESPRTAALRELREETGYAPTDAGRIETLGWTHPNPAIQGNRCHLFVVGPVKKMGELQNPPQEETEVFLVPIEGIADAIRTSTLTHALTLNAFLFVGLNSRRNGFSFEDELYRFTHPASRRERNS